MGLGNDFSEVHHLTPLTDVDGSYEVDPIGDLRSLCCNCDAMIHRRDLSLRIVKKREVVDGNEAP